MSILNEENIQIMMDLGLSQAQARVYLVLCRIGTANVKTISNNINSARQDIYRVLPDLIEMGIVEKIIASPNKFKPLPFKEGCFLLLEKQRIEQNNLQKKTLLLKHNTH